jgi:hypothetical protein
VDGVGWREEGEGEEDGGGRREDRGGREDGGGKNKESGRREKKPYGDPPRLRYEQTRAAKLSHS